ncbi:MAG: hypothetical protein WBV46_19105 [Terriglobales bacterium]|jgi:hypothetical protein
MKPTMAISVCVLAAGLVLAQNSVGQNSRAGNGAGNKTAPRHAHGGMQPPAHAHGVAPKHTVVVEKTSAPKVEPVPQKKIGEIVGSAPVAADGTSGDEASASDKYNANGKRDPFVSPVIARVGGPNCSTGKKCLEIGTVNLRGVVHGENGFIAVVSNGLNKAYFLRENDPVFNGYVVKITGDSIVFQETLQDRLGKTFTREVTKKITVPAV